MKFTSERSELIIYKLLNFVCNMVFSVVIYTIYMRMFQLINVLRQILLEPEGVISM